MIKHKLKNNINNIKLKLKEKINRFFRLNRENYEKII